MKTDKKYFKIKYGYSVSDQISVDENDLEKAIYAQVKGVPIQIGNAYVNGKNIIAITPHWHRHTGWYDWYEPQSGEDWKQIQRDCPNYDGAIEHAKERVNLLINTGRIKLIGKGIELPELKKLEQPKEEVSKLTGDIAQKFSIS
jgi:hypothetical protein